MILSIKKHPVKQNPLIETKVRIPEQKTNGLEEGRQNYSEDHHPQDTEPWTSFKVKDAKPETSDWARGKNVPGLLVPLTLAETI